MTTILLSVLVLFGSASVHKLDETQQNMTGAAGSNQSVAVHEARKNTSVKNKSMTRVKRHY